MFQGFEENKLSLGVFQADLRDYLAEIDEVLSK